MCFLCYLFCGFFFFSVRAVALHASWTCFCCSSFVHFQLAQYWSASLAAFKYAASEFLSYSVVFLVSSTVFSF